MERFGEISNQNVEKINGANLGLNLVIVGFSDTETSHGVLSEAGTIPMTSVVAQ